HQASSAVLLKSRDPFVGCFSSDSVPPAQLDQGGFVAQPFTDKSPSLRVFVMCVPRHMASEVSPMR
ncbi:MAG TPA: hypothetical protein VHE61_12365, partial [Opitutaceae bacterium]|nr:hypothetical protein [Opitutaceae bacterium]